MLSVGRRTIPVMPLFGHHIAEQATRDEAGYQSVPGGDRGTLDAGKSAVAAGCLTPAARVPNDGEKRCAWTGKRLYHKSTTPRSHEDCLHRTRPLGGPCVLHIAVQRPPRWAPGIVPGHQSPEFDAFLMTGARAGAKGRTSATFPRRIGARIGLAG